MSMMTKEAYAMRFSRPLLTGLLGWSSLLWLMLFLTYYFKMYDEKDLSDQRFMIFGLITFIVGTAYYFRLNIVVEINQIGIMRTRYFSGIKIMNKIAKYSEIREVIVGDYLGDISIKLGNGKSLWIPHDIRLTEGKLPEIAFEPAIFSRSMQNMLRLKALIVSRCKIKDQ